LLEDKIEKKFPGTTSNNFTESISLLFHCFLPSVVSNYIVPSHLFTLQFYENIKGVIEPFPRESFKLFRRYALPLPALFLKQYRLPLQHFFVPFVALVWVGIVRLQILQLAYPAHRIHTKL